MLRRWRGVGFAAALGVVLCLALPARSFIPRAQRVVAAVANANVSAHRTDALRFQVRLRVGDAPAVAKGELIIHPTGLARLELRASGLVERHLLQGTEHTAARNGRILNGPRAFLPPLFLLQGDSPAVLEAALRSLGVRAGAISLAPCGESDCYVLGDAASTAADDGEAGGEQQSETRASVWVDTERFDLVRIEAGSGVRVEFGPYIDFAKVRIPKWWTIEEFGKRPVRFEVDAVSTVNAAAAAFSRTWLLAPSDDPIPEEDSSIPKNP